MRAATGFIVGFSAVALVAAIRMLPWWGILALFAGLTLGAAVLVRWSLPRLLLIPFRAKGAVLRGAVVDLHAIARVEPPAAGPDEPAEREPRDHFRIEVTIAPRPSPGPFRLWEPGELIAAGPDARPGAPRDGETQFDVAELEVWEDGRFQADRGMKYGGAQRLRLLVAVPPGRRHLRFRYYLEVFGDLSLPGSTAPAAGRRPPVATAP